MEIICPHCNETIEVGIQIISEKNVSLLWITRKEYSIDLSKLRDDREYDVLGYEADMDRFKVTKRVKNDT